MFSETTYDIILSAGYILAALFYCVFLQFLAKVEYFYKKKKSVLTDETRLENLSKRYGVSEYAFFLIAADQWRISEKQAKAAFKTYLKNGHIPYYVRDFLRHHPHETENDDKFNSN
ncbi:MAG: hypothetical protein R6U27_17275 [Desulfobacterales bacterium]